MNLPNLKFLKTFPAGLGWGFFLILFSVWVPPAQGSDIVLQLSGDPEHPGVLSLKKGNNEIKRLCLIGIQGKGNLDRNFIRFLSQQEIPAGKYAVALPLREEKWPAGMFLKNGALRFRPVTDKAGNQMQKLGKQGLAVHGRDFYPIVMPLADKKELVNYYNDLLFQRLTRYWGTFRITNWDMDRLYDFWSRHTESPEEWVVTVSAVHPEKIRRLCKPPVVKRKPD